MTKVIILAVCVVVAGFAIVRMMLVPRTKMPSAEDNWQQRDGTEMPSTQQSLPIDNVGTGFDIAYRGGPR